MSKKNNGNIVYSTNPDFEYENEENETSTLLPHQQLLKIFLDRKQRKGKTVTIIRNFIGSEDDLKDLGKALKQKCGIGGSAKDGEIILQGEVRNKVTEFLEKEGYNCKHVGG